MTHWPHRLAWLLAGSCLTLVATGLAACGESGGADIGERMAALEAWQKSQGGVNQQLERWVEAQSEQNRNFIAFIRKGGGHLTTLDAELVEQKRDLAAVKAMVRELVERVPGARRPDGGK